MHIDNVEVDKKHFQQPESVKNNWSLSELKRPYDSSLYERLELSKDNERTIEVAAKGCSLSILQI